MQALNSLDSLAGRAYSTGRISRMDVMIELSATIRNEQGIHCRPSARIVADALKVSCAVHVVSPSGDADLRSLLSLVSLGLHEGDVVRIRVEGEDEEAVCRHFVELFETHFDFPPNASADSSLATGPLRGG